MLTNPVITKIDQQQLLTDRPTFKVGDTIAVVIRVIEGVKYRPKTFQVVFIAIFYRGLHSSFIVRKVSHGTGVERTFMLHSRSIQEIRIVRTGLVRQAKIYYMRERSGKSARISERFDKKLTATTAKNDEAAAPSATEPAIEQVAVEETVIEETVAEETVAEETVAEQPTTEKTEAVTTAATSTEDTTPASDAVDDAKEDSK